MSGRGLAGLRSAACPVEPGDGSLPGRPLNPVSPLRSARALLFRPCCPTLRRIPRPFDEAHPSLDEGDCRRRPHRRIARLGQARRRPTKHAGKGGAGPATGGPVGLHPSPVSYWDAPKSRGAGPGALTLSPAPEPHSGRKQAWRRAQETAEGDRAAATPRQRRRPLAAARPGAGERVLRPGPPSPRRRLSLDIPVMRRRRGTGRPGRRDPAGCSLAGLSAHAPAFRLPRPHPARPDALARLPRPGDLLRGRARRARTASAPSPRSCSTGSAIRPGRTASAASSIRGRCAPAAAASSPSPATARSAGAPGGPGLGAGAPESPPRRWPGASSRRSASRPIYHTNAVFPGLGAAAAQDRGDRRAQFLPPARPAGAPGAFNAAYAGSEPLPRPSHDPAAGAATSLRSCRAALRPRRPIAPPSPALGIAQDPRWAPPTTCPFRPSARNIATPANGAPTPRPRSPAR